MKEREREKEKKKKKKKKKGVGGEKKKNEKSKRKLNVRCRHRRHSYQDSGSVFAQQLFHLRHHLVLDEVRYRENAPVRVRLAHVVPRVLPVVVGSSGRAVRRMTRRGMPGPAGNRYAVG